MDPINSRDQIWWLILIQRSHNYKDILIWRETTQVIHVLDSENYDNGIHQTKTFIKWVTFWKGETRQIFPYSKRCGPLPNKISKVVHFLEGFLEQLSLEKDEVVSYDPHGVISK